MTIYENSLSRVAYLYYGNWTPRGDINKRNPSPLGVTDSGSGG